MKILTNKQYNALITELEKFKKIAEPIIKEEEKMRLQREEKERQWDNVFSYNETIATKGRGDK